MRVVGAIAAVAMGLVVGSPVVAGEFTFNEKTNQEMAKRLNIPVYFAVPASARATLPKTFNTTDRLIEFRHPDAKGAKGDLGLRLIVAKRAGFGRRMAQSGLLQTGDILLTFRPEWGGAGTYPNIQMGISHTGIAYVKNGTIHHLDMPLDVEHNGSQIKGDFSGNQYRTLKYLHVIRPRGLTAVQRANILDWITRLQSGASRIYPTQIAFNTDYNAPKYVRGKPLEFVRYVARAALAQNPEGARTDMYCSEFVWSILALRNCDPATTADVLKGRNVPSCVSAPMTPMKATGNYISSRSSSSQAGLTDGPLLVIDALKLPNAKRDALLSQVFVENPSKAAQMSQGHREIAQTMQPKFAPMEKYYKDVSNGGWRRIQAYFVGNAFRRAIPENYSPTSYLINTLLPSNNTSRTMDYVATVVFD
ncbi:MAG: hypothetical protein AB7E81_01060 [Hyphomicrobiaceae bacterium]